MNKVVINDFAPLADKYARVSVWESTPCQSIGDLLNINKRELINYASLTGQGINLLDFDLELAEEGDNIGYVSSACSDHLKNFETPIVIYIDFDDAEGSLFSAPGITFHFWKNYCTKMTVEWWHSTDSGMEVISRKEIYPTSLDYYFENPVEEFNFIKIEFEKTEVPHQFVKLAGIDLGRVREITDFHSNIEIFSEISPDCTDVPASTCDFIAEITDFKPQNMQELYVYGGKEEKLFGKFTIDRVPAIGKNIYSFECSDEIMTINNTPFPKKPQSVILSQNLVAEIEENANVYIECTDNSDIQLTGFIEEKQNARTAAAMVSFATGSFLTGFGSRFLRILKPKSRKSKIISSSQILGRAEYTTVKAYSNITVNQYKENFDVVFNSRTVKNPSRKAYEIGNQLLCDQYSMMSDIDKKMQELTEAGFQPNEITARIIYSDEAPGDICGIETPYDGLKTGIIKNLAISIGHRITATVKMIERNFASDEE